MYEQEREEGAAGQKWEDEEQGVSAVAHRPDGTIKEDAAAYDGERYSAEQRPAIGRASEAAEQVSEDQGTPDSHQQSLQGVPDQDSDEQPNDLAQAEQAQPDRALLTPPRQAQKASAASHPPEAENVSQTPSGANSKLPPWMKSESKPYLSKDERRLYKLFTFLPVVVTFIIYTMLLVYYICFYLYPSIIGDFYTTWQIPYMWSSVAEKEQSALTAKILSGVFAFTSLSLLVNLVLTIATDPGQIPEEPEWDMPEEKDETESKASSALPKQQKALLGSEVDAPAPEPRGSASSDLSHQIAFQNRFATGVLRAPLAGSRSASPGHLPDGEEAEGGSQIVDNDLPAANDPQNRHQNTYYNQASSPRYEIEQDQELQKPLVQREEVDAGPSAAARPGGATANPGGAFSIERKQYGGVRICQRCLRAKPDRTHHCSQCHRCVLKMDHHCDWVGNCIGFSNYKYFLNTLFYASASTIIIAVSSSRVASHALKISEVPAGSAVFIVIAYVLACVLAIIITCFFLFHLWLTTNQYTTIEYREKRTSDLFKNRSPYDLGAYRNLQAVLGENPLVWLLPFARNLDGSGLRFQARPDLKAAASSPKSKPSESKQK